MYKNKINNVEILTLDKKGISDFANERNLMLKKSKSEWVFFLDKDEKISKDLLKELKKIKSSDKYNGYYVYRDNYFFNKFVGSDKIVRLVKKEKGRWHRKVHEILKVKGKVGVLKGRILHYSENNLHSWISKINYYSTLHADANFIENKKSNIFKIIFFPILKFLQSLFQKRGFMISLLQSLHSFLSWVKLWEQNKV